MYRLVYISTRNFDGSPVPVELFDPIPMDAVYNDYNEADRMRCELCSIMNFGFVKTALCSPKIKVADVQYNANAIIEDKIS